MKNAVDTDAEAFREKHYRGKSGRTGGRPSADEELDAVGLAMEDWTRLAMEGVQREARGPNGAMATVIDNVIAPERGGL